MRWSAPPCAAVVATCELVNCAGVEVQCTGAVPTVAVDKCDGCQVCSSRLGRMQEQQQWAAPQHGLCFFIVGYDAALLPLSDARTRTRHTPGWRRHVFLPTPPPT